MKNLDLIVDPDDVVTKRYADSRIAVQAVQPTDGAEIWIDTDEPDPLTAVHEQIASLAARLSALEALQ